GEARLSMALSGPSLVALYTGDTLDALTPVGSITEPLTQLRTQVTKGTEYLIAVDGARPEPTGKPTMGSFDLQIALVPSPEPWIPSPETEVPVAPDREIPTEFTPN